MNLITLLTQSAPVLIDKQEIYVLKNAELEIHVAREMTPIYSLGNTDPRSFSRSRRTLNGTITLTFNKIDDVLTCITKTGRLGVQHDNHIVLLEDIVVSRIEQDREAYYKLRFDANSMQYLQRERLTYVYTLTRSHEI